MTAAAQSQTTEVLFIRVSPELKEQIKQASKSRGTREGEVRRRGNINRMLVELLERTYGEEEKADAGS